MNKDTKSPTKKYVLDMPISEADPTYLNTFFNIVNQVSSVIVDSRSDDAYRISLLCDLCINIIPDIETRKRLKEMKTQLINERCGSSCEQSYVDTIRKEVSIELLGYVSDDMDESIGIKRKNIIGSP